MHEIQFDAPFEFDGHWRLGEVDGVGRFSYEPNLGLSVTFTGRDTELDEHLSLGPEPLVITGQTSSRLSKEVTFQDCYLTHQESSRAQTTATFLVNRAFFGSRAGSAVTDGVSEVCFSMTELEDWVRPAGNFLEPEPRYRSGVRKTIDVHLADTADVEFAAGDAVVTLQSFIAGHTSRKEASFTASSLFTIRFVEPQVLDAVLGRFVRPIENFITLGSGKVNALRTLLYRRRVGEKAESVDVLFPSPQARSRGTDWLTWPRGLFSLWDVQETLAERLTRWFDVYERHRTVCDQMFHTIYHRPYLESYYLWLVQTLEGYHRLRTDLTQLRVSKADYRAMMRAAVSAVSKDRRELFLRATQHGNEVSLKDRLAEMLERYGRLIPAVLTEEERNNFPAQCAMSRNAIAHHILPEDGLDLQRLHKFTDFILRLLAAALMQEIGFSESEIFRSMQNGASLFPKKALGA